MNAEKILAHCRKAKQTGSGTWIACCPAHDDKRPSLTLRELPDGMLLVHCFAGCSLESIIGACGLKVEDLFPEKITRDMVKPIRQRFPAADVLLMVEQEMNIMAIVAGDLAAGRALSEQDAERMKRARTRIEEARRLALG